MKEKELLTTIISDDEQQIINVNGLFEVVIKKSGSTFYVDAMTLEDSEYGHTTTIGGFDVCECDYSPEKEDDDYDEDYDDDYDDYEDRDEDEEENF